MVQDIGNQLLLEIAHKGDFESPDQLPEGFSELNRNELIFVRNYLDTGNGQLAAERAGYSKEHARIQASKLLRKPRVRRVLDASIKQSSVSVPKLLERVWERAQSSHARYLQCIEEHNYRMAREAQAAAQKEDALLAQILGKATMNLNISGDVNHTHLHMSEQDLERIAEARRMHYAEHAE